MVMTEHLSAVAAFYYLVHLAADRTRTVINVQRPCLAYTFDGNIETTYIAPLRS